MMENTLVRPPRSESEMSMLRTLVGVDLRPPAPLCSNSTAHGDKLTRREHSAPTTARAAGAPAPPKLLAGALPQFTYEHSSEYQRAAHP